MNLTVKMSYLKSGLQLTFFTQFTGQTKRPAAIAVAYMPHISGRQNIMLTWTVVRVNVNGLTLDA